MSLMMKGGDESEAQKKERLVEIELLGLAWAETRRGLACMFVWVVSYVGKQTPLVSRV